MGGTGTSMVMALAAVLWLVYLVPAWMRRRQYLATELNAVRLQQTLRILAETAELPEAVRAESDARAVVADRARLRRVLEDRRDAERDRAVRMADAAARTRAALLPSTGSDRIDAFSPAGLPGAASVTSASAPAISTPVVASPGVAPSAVLSSAAIRLRRSRLAVTAVLSVAVASAVVGLLSVLGLTLVTSSAGSALLLAGSGLGAGCLLLLSRFAAVARARAIVARRLHEQAAHVLVEAPRAEPDAEPAGWMPVPLPLPLYLSKPEPQRLVPGPALEDLRTRALLEAAAGGADGAVDAEQATVTAIGSADRYARMGRIDRSGATVTDIDDALRRRRAV